MQLSGRFNIKKYMRIIIRSCPQARACEDMYMTQQQGVITHNYDTTKPLGQHVHTDTSLVFSVLSTTNSGDTAES